MRRLVLALALGALAAGCGSDDEEGPDRATVQAITFQAETATEGEKLLDLGGLTLTGYCRREAGQRHLAVTAATSETWISRAMTSWPSPVTTWASSSRRSDRWFAIKTRR